MRTDGPVVVALDGSGTSAHTLEWGVAEAVRRQADLLLVRGVDDWLATAWSWYPNVVADDPEATVVTYLAEQRAQVLARHPGTAVRTQVLHGHVVPALRELSAGAQLLVVGARTRTGRARTGSTGVHVAAHARCPVTVVRSDPGNPVGPDAAVVVGVDGSPTSMTAAHAAAREARARGRSLTVVHARPTIPDPFGRGSVPPLATDDEDDPTHKAAQVVAESLRAEHGGLTVDLTLVDDDPVDALARLSRDAALLVVGSRGLGGFRGMLLGSVSSGVIREATCPVLVVHDDS
ncbi:universal stress protein [Cellulomonas sp.]|uniref:universal stress protein n=1 Tax=Cellulomonas sp. TaxID=40001 RepID=UPI001B0BC674|nr:universal stress protein [Cellulomonas sp.]MBO9556640.1 universal stress protein [Cellulomonas sp.]